MQIQICSNLTTFSCCGQLSGEAPAKHFDQKTPQAQKKINFEVQQNNLEAAKNVFEVLYLKWANQWPEKKIFSTEK